MIKNEQNNIVTMVRDFEKEVLDKVAAMTTPDDDDLNFHERRLGYKAQKAEEAADIVKTIARNFVTMRKVVMDTAKNDDAGIDMQSCLALSRFHVGQLTISERFEKAVGLSKDISNSRKGKLFNSIEVSRRRFGKMLQTLDP